MGAGAEPGLGSWPRSAGSRLRLPRDGYHGSGLVALAAEAPRAGACAGAAARCGWRAGARYLGVGTEGPGARDLTRTGGGAVDVWCGVRCLGTSSFLLREIFSHSGLHWQSGLHSLRLVGVWRAVVPNARTSSGERKFGAVCLVWSGGTPPAWSLRGLLSPVREQCGGVTRVMGVCALFTSGVPPAIR